MKGYMHKVQYYETDKMGITHHSNYIRWMEESRVYYLEVIGLPYDYLEQRGVISPVVSVSFEYKAPTKFADEVYIEACLREYSGVKMYFEYTFTKKDGTLVGKATSKHCFTDENGRPKSIKKLEDIHEKLSSTVEI